MVSGLWKSIGCVLYACVCVNNIILCCHECSILYIGFLLGVMVMTKSHALSQTMLTGRLLSIPTTHLSSSCRPVSTLYPATTRVMWALIYFYQSVTNLLLLGIFN
jgi:hypothetical protein